MKLLKISSRENNIAFPSCFPLNLNRKKLKSVPDMADVHAVMSNGTFDVGEERSIAVS